MTDPTGPDSIRGDEDVAMQPLRDGDTSIESDPTADEAHAEWEGTDVSADPDEVTATGDDPAHLPSPDDEIPPEDLHVGAAGAESQGLDPVEVDLGDDGQGDLAPEDS